MTSVLLGLCLLNWGLRAAEEATYYRLVSSTNNAIESVASSGIVTLTNGIAEEAFQIERRVDTGAESTGWVPYVRGYFTNHVASLKLFDPATPRGMVYIPAGHFVMGDNKDGFTEHVAIVSPFYIDVTEVTNEDFCKMFRWGLDNAKLQIISNSLYNVEGDTAPQLFAFNVIDSLIAYKNGEFAPRAGRMNHPGVSVTWFGALAYCNLLSLYEGLEPCYNLQDWTCDFKKNGYRLPTETEWEKAARGGYEGRRFPWGETTTHEHANYRSLTNNWYDVSATRGFHPVYDSLYRPLRTSPIKSFEPNGFGLYDVIGNVYEWCWDVVGTYSGETLVDPTGPQKPVPTPRRILKGGNWFTTAERTTLGSRYMAAPPGYITADVGFRKVRRAP